MIETRPLHILFVDDNPDDSLLLMKELCRELPNAGLVQAQNADELASHLDTGGFDLVVTDYHLGWATGLDVFRAVKTRYPDCPVIMATGTESEGIAVEAMKAGLDDYVLKEVNHLARFLFVVRSALENVKRSRQLGEAQATVQRQLGFVEQLINAIPNPIFYTDAQGAYLGCNKAFEQQHGVKREEIVGKSVHDVFQKRTANMLHKKDQELLKRPGVQIYETIARHADGSPYDTIDSKATFTDPDGSLKGIVGVSVDISELKRARDERERLASAMEQVEEGVVTTAADWTIQYVNPAFVSLSGYSPELCIGRSFHEIMGAHYTGFEYDDKGTKPGDQMLGKSRDGTERDVVARFSPAYDPEGSVTGYVGILRDTTHEIRLEKLLRQAQKMEAVGTLAGGIAHDFNNILGAISGFTELSMFDLEENSPIRPNLERVLEAARRAKDLVRQILTFSRQRDQEKQPTQVSLIVKEALKLLRSSLPSTIEIRQNIRSSSLLLADPTQIHQILMNLCSNASHAMQEKGGALDVSLENVDLPRDPEVVSQLPGLEPGPYLRLSVSDTGYGIDPAIQHRIFDPYFTTKKIGEGTGLGLAVVDGIVKDSGGMVNVFSEPGKGTVFHVWLPRLESTRDKADRVETAEPLPGGNETILLVDDEKSLVEAGRQMLARLGYQVVVRLCPAEALAAFLAQPGKFDMVITDHTMPKMTGIELAREILAVRPEMPIILCTGFSAVLGMTPDKARAVGIREMIMKPVIMRDLAETVRRVLTASD